MTEELKRLLACLGQLDEDRRRMVLLAYYSGWSRDQLAAQVRCAGEYDQDLAAAQPDADPGVPRVMSMDEDRDGFAAEYVLGTLDADERAQADALMLVDPAFAASVRALGAPARRAQRAGRAGRAASAGVGADQGGSSRAQGRRKACICPKCRRRRCRPYGADAPGADIVDLTQRMRRWRGLHRHHRNARGLLRRHRAGARVPAGRAAARLAAEAAGRRADRREAGRGGARGRARVPARVPRSSSPCSRRTSSRPRSFSRRHREAHADGAQVAARAASRTGLTSSGSRPRPGAPPESLGLLGERTSSRCARRSPRTSRPSSTRDLRHLARARSAARRPASRPSPVDPREAAAGDALDCGASQKKERPEGARRGLRRSLANVKLTGRWFLRGR